LRRREPHFFHAARHSYNFLVRGILRRKRALRQKECRVANADENNLLEIVLDSWDRNSRILVNLLRALPDGGLAARVTSGSPTVAEMFTHMHFVRLIFLSEDVPECALPLPKREWLPEGSPERIAEELERSAGAVRNAVESRIRSDREMNLHYDHPLLYLQHMIWHEGYHHGQIKLALKVTGLPFDDEKIGPLTWGIWMDKNPRG
jgi:uncharacterized damage-inducible protein DinB